MKTKRFLIYLTCTLFLITICNQPASCKWDDNSDDLPGQSSTNLTPILIGGGIVITGLITYAIISKSKKKKMTASSSSINLTQPATSTNSQENFTSFYNEMESAAAQSPVEVFLVSDIAQISPINYQAHTNIGLGLRFKF